MENNASDDVKGRKFCKNLEQLLIWSSFLRTNHENVDLTKINFKIK